MWKKEPRRGDTHSPEVGAVATLGELSDDTSSTAGARPVADGGGDERLLDGMGGSTLLTGDDLDTSRRRRDVDSLTDAFLNIK